MINRAASAKHIERPPTALLWDLFNLFFLFNFMARFQIQKIIFDTRTLDKPIDNQRLAKKLEKKWQGKIFDCTIPEIEEEGIESNLDSLVNYMDFTDWLCYEIHLKSLDIQVDSPLEYKESWGGGEYAFYPINRHTYLRVS